MKRAIVLIVVWVLVPVGPVFADTFYVSTNECTALQTVGAATVFPEQVAQKFTAPQTGIIEAVFARYSKNGSPGDNIVIGIQADSGGSPSGSYLGSASIAAAGVSSYPTYNGATSTLSAAVNVVSGASYWFVFSRSGALNDADNYDDCGTSSGSNKKAYITGSWSAVANQTSGFAVNIVDGTSTPSTAGGLATSSLEQIQTNLYHGFVIFFVTMFGIMWVFRKR